MNRNNLKEKSEKDQSNSRKNLPSSRSSVAKTDYIWQTDKKYREILHTKKTTSLLLCSINLCVYSNEKWEH